MNDLMSGGIHRVWKDYFIRKMGPTSRTKLLDVAGGTGDISFRFLDYLKVQKSPPQEVYCDSIDDNDDISWEDSSEPHVVVCDINDNMLKVGRRRAKLLGYLTNISWKQGDAENLPFAEDVFDAYSIAFGIRNVIHIEKALDEAYRVLRPGGRFLCIEFSHVPNPALKWVYDNYSFQVIPPLGQVVAGDWKSYQYLVESIRKFPNQEDFKYMIENAGFRCVTYENLTFGVTAIHSGFKI
ncbi:2-methoxy-6-polyprenyl-1,4-benzoquinol methylase, mitochondrial-like isoform X2 [Artemia franciscana]|nr:hypothetical protein QYM36_012742 [Artemia franciscana]